MSYILEALQRAEAERQRELQREGGAVPGLDAPTPWPLVAAGSRWTRNARIAWVAAATAGTGLAIAAAWIWRSSGPAPNTPGPLPAPVSTRASIPLAVSVPSVRAPAAASISMTVQMPVPVAVPKTVASSELPGPPADSPRLSVGGAMDSEAPAQRLLILNGQAYHEGEHPAPDLTLERIRLNSAVLDYRGQRYTIRY